MRQRVKVAHNMWTQDQMEQLVVMIKNGSSLAEVGKVFNRSAAAIALQARVIRKIAEAITPQAEEEVLKKYPNSRLAIDMGRYLRSKGTSLPSTSLTPNDTGIGKWIEALDNQFDTLKIAILELAEHVARESSKDISANKDLVISNQADMIEELQRQIKEYQYELQQQKETTLGDSLRKKFMSE